MSRGRRRRLVHLVAEDGTRREHRLPAEKDPPPLVDVAPPRASWLVEVLDPSKHRVAVLTVNAGLDPVLYTDRHGEPSYVLLPDGLAGALVTGRTIDAPTVVPLDAPGRPQVPVSCPLCRAEWQLDAARLHAARGSKPGKPGRFTVGVSHTA